MTDNIVFTQEEAIFTIGKIIEMHKPQRAILSSNIAHSTEIDALLEANTKTAFTKLQAFSKLVSTRLKQVNSETRLNIHLAAVFGCNFTNALYAASYQLFEKALSKKEIELLQPILKQSFDKMLTLGPLNAQTGPAKRNDKITMQKHLELLKSTKKLTSIYKIVSELIQTQQHVKLQRKIAKNKNISI